MENFNFKKYLSESKLLKEEISPSNILQKCIEDLKEQIQFAIYDEGLEEYSDAYYTLMNLVNRWEKELVEMEKLQ